MPNPLSAEQLLKLVELKLTGAPFKVCSRADFKDDIWTQMGTASEHCAIIVVDCDPLNPHIARGDYAFIREDGQTRKLTSGLGNDALGWILYGKELQAKMAAAMKAMDETIMESLFTSTPMKKP